MKKTIKYLSLGIILLTFIGCFNSNYCGQAIDENEFSDIHGKVEDIGFTVTFQLAIATSNEFGDQSKINFELEYATQDTLVFNVLNIPDEKSAKIISCMLKENEIVKQTKVVYARFIVNEKLIAFKF